MLARAIALVILLAAELPAADADFRAGLWEGTIGRGRGIERIVLLLTISAQGMNGPHAITNAWARVESNSGICGSNSAAIETNRVAFDCINTNKPGEREAAGGRFEGYFSPRSNLVSGTWRGEPIQLTRPPQTDSLTSEGDWVAEGAGQTCVLRFFDGNRSRLMSNGGGATIDIYSKERAVFGRQLHAVVYQRRGLAGMINFGWEDTDQNRFSGNLDANNNELTGIWQGNDFVCGAPDHKITFRWTRSSL